jgi:hypothetical protein
MTRIEQRRDRMLAGVVVLASLAIAAVIAFWS